LPASTSWHALEGLGRHAYADRAVAFLNAWSSTLTEITGNADRYLAAGIYGLQFANAAEIMRTYSGWAATDFARFQKMMLEVFLPAEQPLLARAQRCCHHELLGPTGTSARRLRAGRRRAVRFAKTSTTRPSTTNRSGQGNGSGLQAVYHVHPATLARPGKRPRPGPRHASVWASPCIHVDGVEPGRRLLQL
jgi:hypothetical protein